MANDQAKAKVLQEQEANKIPASSSSPGLRSNMTDLVNVQASSPPDQMDPEYLEELLAGVGGHA